MARARRLFTVYEDRYGTSFQYAVLATSEADAVGRHQQYSQRVHGYVSDPAKLLVVPMQRDRDVLFLTTFEKGA